MRKVFERIRSLLIWTVALPTFAGGCVAVWLGSFVLAGPPLERLIKGACRLVLAVCGIRLAVTGRENFIPGRQYVVMMNHVNFFDPFVLYASFPGFARGVEEESHFHWPLYGPTIRRLGMIPISRKNTARAVESLKAAAAWVRSRPDMSVAILPEGTRTPDGRVGPFKKGGFLLALEARLDILPLVLTGADRINRKGSRLIRPGRVEIVVEPAVPTAGHTKDTASALVDEVRSVFLRRLGQA